MIMAIKNMYISIATLQKSSRDNLPKAKKVGKKNVNCNLITHGALSSSYQLV